MLSSLQQRLPSIGKFVARSRTRFDEVADRYGG
jgi:hypothetical protein